MAGVNCAPMIWGDIQMVWDLFSKRMKRKRGEVVDVLTYASLPDPLRIQIVHIVKDVFGEPDFHDDHSIAAIGYSLVAKVLKKEYGVFQLVEYPVNDAMDVLQFFLAQKDVERALSVVELLFRFVTRVIADDPNYRNRNHTATLSTAEAIEELNERFRESAVGYQFLSDEIIRVDSQLIHAEAVLPALTLLREKGFSGPNREFLEAHSHYRRGDFDDAVVNAAKAFESTLKTICDARRWKYDPNATAKPLINVVLTNKLVPAYFESQLSSLRGLLESTVTVRNKDAGHGAGAVAVDLPEWFARYALNVTASAIVFLVEAHRAKK